MDIDDPVQSEQCVSAFAGGASLRTVLTGEDQVAFEASPITTLLELDVGRQICDMLGYKPISDTIGPWGHIASDGTLANLEALWYGLMIHLGAILSESFPSVLQGWSVLEPKRSGYYS